MATAVCDTRGLGPRLELLPIQEQSRPIFNAEFLDRRMKQHQEWQDRETNRLCEGALDEIGVTIPYRVRITRPLPFEEQP